MNTCILSIRNNSNKNQLNPTHQSTKIEMPEKQPTKKLNLKLMSRQRYIINLSSKTLSPPWVHHLYPAEPHQLTKSLDDFDRSNRLKHFFRNRTSTEPHPFSTWNPPVASPIIKEYLKTEMNTLHPLKITQNLTPI